MITVKKLKELLDKLPDDARLIAYEGEGVGLRVISVDDDNAGWIETGYQENHCSKDWEHDIKEFLKN